MMKRILLGILGFYRDWLSPAVHVVSPWGCRYRPTCSEYAIEAIVLYGAARGAWMALCRLLRCHPFSRCCSFDPVPLPGVRPSGLKGPQERRSLTARALHDPIP